MTTQRWDASMLRQQAKANWWLPGLGAKGPLPELQRELQLFGQLVGDWEIFSGPSVPKPAGADTAGGEVHVAWVLGGTAVQDIWGPLDPASRCLVPHGTTLRFYDRDLGAWRSTWLSPYQRAVRSFIGRRVGREIVLRERGRGEMGEHWIFSDLTPASFRWRAETRSHPGRPRKITEDYWIRRKRRVR